MNFIDSLKDIRVTKERTTWKIRNLSKRDETRLAELGLMITNV